MFIALSNRLLTAVIVCSLLLQSCRSGLRAITEEEPPTPAGHVPDAGGTLSSGALVLAPSRTDARVSGSLGSMSPTKLVGTVVPASSRLFMGPFTASSGECVLLSQQQGQWQAVLQGGAGTMMHRRTLPVVSSGNIGTLLSSLQGQDVWSSRSRIHVLTAPAPLHSPCVYLGKLGLLGGSPTSQAEAPAGEWIAGPTMILDGDAEIEKITGGSSVHDGKRGPIPVFGAKEWIQYFGEVGEEPSLPSDIDEILDSPCPFWPGQRVKDTHLLVLMPSTVDGKAFTLDLLEELTYNSRGGGHSTQYFLYDDEVQRSSGDVYSSSSYWVLLTRDVLPGSRNKPYEAQRALIAAQSSHVDDPSYGIPNVLEAATAILSYYVRSGHRLYAGGGDVLPSASTRCTTLLEDAAEYPSPFTVGRFCDRGLVFLSGFEDDAEFGVSCLRRFGNRHYRPSALLHSFGAEAWSRYFGEVEKVPPLPVNIVDMLNSACPFWPGKQVKDTHLLVLIPAKVNGKPYNLNLLGELIQHPKGGGHATKYRNYGSDTQKQFGAQSPSRSYWMLMTRDVFEGSRRKTYTDQKSLVARHASRTGLPYELPGALEAATAILSHYVRSGERLYTDAPWTWTRCRELEDSKYPVAVGGFSSGGLSVYVSYVDYLSSGVAGFRKF